ncbi:LOW QUALITY PROTEIN: hypothetical protein QYF61_020985 [Mycteria americana]|uniref:Uncharacterized protein n=1 Tax=Mycteria americana TaxID=33587 RepID=A0AAN7P739_MYCAM|nr:LOW QUALITY PROTEIN: hypothetical protein QYF61_020985 [Mycteria americana]
MSEWCLTCSATPEHRITESQNHIGWKRPLRSSSPTINLTLPKPPLHHVSKHLIQTSFKYLQGWRLNHFPGQPVPMLDNPLGEEKFPNIQSKPPLAQLEAISSCPITCYLGEETDPYLSTTSFQVVEENDKVSPQPPFLQAKQSQLPQPLLIRLTLHQLRCPSLHTLQYLNIPLVVGGPKLNTVFEGHDHFPSPAGHAIFDTSQDAIGFLGRLGTLLAHIQAAVNKHPQVLLCQAAFQPLFPKPVALHGVAVAQVQDLALGLVKPHTVDLGPSSQPVQVPLQSLPTLQQINTPTQLGVICKLTESTLDPFVQIIDKDVKQNCNDTSSSHEEPVPVLDNPYGEEIFPNIQPKPPLVQLEAISSHPITCYLGEETDPHLSKPHFRLNSPSSLSCSSQDLFSRPFTSFVALLWTRSSTSMRRPKLNTVFEVQPYQCRVRGHNHFPTPAGHTIPDTSQDAINLLGHLGTLLAHIQAAVDQHPQVLFCQAAFQPLFPKPVALHGVVVTQVQDLALGLVEPHTIGPSPSIQPVQIPLQSLPTLKQINTPAQLGVVCKLTEGALDPLVQIIDKDIK